MGIWPVVMLGYGYFQVENMQLGNSCRSNENKSLIDAMVQMICRGVTTVH